MRALLTLALLLMCSCSAAVSPDEGASPSPALPAVADLDRMASESDVFAAERLAFLGTIDGDVLSRDGAPIAWALYRIGPVDPQFSYTWCKDGATPFDYETPEGIWTAVADFSAGAGGVWRFRDLTAEPIIVPPVDIVAVGIDLSRAVQPVSPEGYIYYAVLTVDEPVIAGDNDMLIEWED